MGTSSIFFYKKGPSKGALYIQLVAHISLSFVSDFQHPASGGPYHTHLLSICTGAMPRSNSRFHETITVVCVEQDSSRLRRRKPFVHLAADNMLLTRASYPEGSTVTVSM